MSEESSGEEIGVERARDEGVLRVTTSSLKIPDGIESTDASEGTDRVVLVVLTMAIAFIVFIAWLIHGGQ